MMPPDRHSIATRSGVAHALEDELRATWPLPSTGVGRGYRPLDLADTTLLAALALDEQRAVAVVGRRTGPPTALPCILEGGRWRIARAGDGAARALLALAPEATPPSAPEATLPSAPALRRYRLEPIADGAERELGTDQSNMSVVVGDTAIVKWRSAPDADGRRATLLRRHLQANDFSDAPALLASLIWADEQGHQWVLADVDAFLEDAEDGWDHAIRLLATSVQGGELGGGLASAFGTLTARLHAALARPSHVTAHTSRAATSTEMCSMRAAGVALLERALALEAPGRGSVLRRAPLLRRALDSFPLDTTQLGLIHGDLHVGQLVAWKGGLGVIDFDGPPEPTEPPGDLGSPARDVAQSVCSLWNLAAVVDARTGGGGEPRLSRWAAAAESAFLGAYREEIGRHALDLLDERLVEPLIAEHFSRELLYAETTLPRWRYAPLQALRWRYRPEA